jgi:integrase
MGEIIALRWCDVDFARGLLTIQQAQWNSVVDGTKGNKSRIVPMTDALATALARAKHLRGERVLYRDDPDGEPEAVTHSTLRSWLLASEKRAGLEQEGCLHKLRHTFGSHLAMRGASPKAIQELMGHENITTTTMRYMHLSPSARRGAIDLLNGRQSHGATMEQALIAPSIPANSFSFYCVT